MLSLERAAYLDAFAQYQNAARSLDALRAQAKQFADGLGRVANECRNEGAVMAAPAGLPELPAGADVNQTVDRCRGAWRSLLHLWAALPAEARAGLKAPAEAAT